MLYVSYKVYRDNQIKSEEFYKLDKHGDENIKEFLFFSFKFSKTFTKLVILICTNFAKFKLSKKQINPAN